MTPPSSVPPGESLEVSGPRGPLHVRRWRVPTDGPSERGRVVVVHGYGEHGGRYAPVAADLTRAGWGVVAPDLWGHGRSPGPRGVLARFDDLVDDVAAVVSDVGTLLPGEGPTLLLGHSMGGLVTIRLVQRRSVGVDGVALSAPWLGEVVGMSRWQRVLSVVLSRLAPQLTLERPLDPELLTRDPEAAAERYADPLVHHRASAGLVREARMAQEQALRDPLPPGVPLLVLIPGDDRLLSHGPTRVWARSHPPDQCRVVELPGRRHEPLNDLGRDEVTELLLAWVDARVTRG